MKKEILITIAILLGPSSKSYAASGNVTDGFEFFLFIVGFLLTLLGLLNCVDYFKKNGKKIIYKAKSFQNKILTLFENYLSKIESNFINKAYF